MIKDNYVIVAGTFDLFHVGHVELLRRASAFGKVIALVNTDRFVEEFKKITPTVNENERMAIIASCFYVFDVYPNDESDLTETLDFVIQMNPGIHGIVFGDDYDIEKYRAQTKITREWQQKYDIALIQLPRTDGVSSSMIRDKIGHSPPTDS